ncbi:hypothetical protein T10_10547 [Trichinella papuae]|uniref:Uncharacterized protein n=1 Tax=Trichinella papuae TaxID=268474 RepID=A0A0V1MQ47_9BILA|nr:hypothetical protein T10_10547 [Trichinella papuae]
MSWGKELWSVKRWKLFSRTRSFNITDLAVTALGASGLTLLVPAKLEHLLSLQQKRTRIKAQYGRSLARSSVGGLSLFDRQR